jgi:hypothetical protein
VTGLTDNCTNSRPRRSGDETFQLEPSYPLRLKNRESRVHGVRRLHQTIRQDLMHPHYSPHREAIRECKFSIVLDHIETTLSKLCDSAEGIGGMGIDLNCYRREIGAWKMLVSYFLCFRTGPKGTLCTISSRMSRWHLQRRSASHESKSGQCRRVPAEISEIQPGESGGDHNDGQDGSSIKIPEC